MNKSLFLVFISCSVFLLSCTKETTIIFPEPDSYLKSHGLLYLNHKECFVDVDRKLFKYSISKDNLSDFNPKISFNPEAKVWFNGQKIENNVIHQLGPIEISKPYSIKILIAGKTIDYKLFFTQLPIIKIIHIEDIKDEPKSLARLYVNNSGRHNMWDSYTGIEIRGNSSQQFRKKSYSLDICLKRDLSSSSKASIFDFSGSSNWMLDAMFIDPSKMRNKVSTEIWQNLFNRKKNKTNFQFKTVELFINDQYYGIYCISQPIKPDFLNITGTNRVLYKADAIYMDGTNGLNVISKPMPTDNLRWDGWQQEYPKAHPNWLPFSRFREVLLNTSDSIFRKEIANTIDLDALIDYYIFMNLAGAWDNTGSNKNLYLLGEGEKNRLTVIPWDLDYTWGLNWLGSTFSADQIISNSLYKRLIRTNASQFNIALVKRWQELRSHALTEEDIFSYFDTNFKVLSHQNIEKFENDRWQTNHNLTNEKKNIQLWISNRFIFLDEYFNAFEKKD